MFKYLGMSRVIRYSHLYSQGQQRCGLWLLLLVLTSQPVNMGVRIASISMSVSVYSCLSLCPRGSSIFCRIGSDSPHRRSRRPTDLCIWHLRPHAPPNLSIFSTGNGSAYVPPDCPVWLGIWDSSLSNRSMPIPRLHAIRPRSMPPNASWSA